jgi:hypothetical protein
MRCSGWAAGATGRHQQVLSNLQVVLIRESAYGFERATCWCCTAIGALDMAYSCLGAVQLYCLIVAHLSAQPAAFNPLIGVARVVSRCTLIRHKGVTTVDIICSACNPFTLGLHMPAYMHGLGVAACILLECCYLIYMPLTYACSGADRCMCCSHVKPHHIIHTCIGGSNVPGGSQDQPQGVGVQATAQGQVTRLRPVSPSNCSSARGSTG